MAEFDVIQVFDKLSLLPIISHECKGDNIITTDCQRGERGDEYIRQAQA